MNFKPLFAGALALSTLSGCYLQTYSVELADDQPVLMNATSRKQQVERFKAEEHQVFFLGGLVPVTKPNLSEVVKREAQGKPVERLKVTSEMTLADALWTYGEVAGFAALVWRLAPQDFYPATIGAMLLFPQHRTVTVEGDVVGGRAKREDKREENRGGNQYLR